MPNLKKCWVAESGVSPVSAGLIACLTMGLGAGGAAFIFPASGWAEVPPTSLSAPTPGDALRESLKQDIDSNTSASFAGLLRRWSDQYGAQAVPPLLSLVSDPHLPDRARYIALMGAARLGGRGTAPLIMPHLKDSSWMIRSGTLRALSALQDPTVAFQVLPLLKDPALVVRVEAVEAVRALRPSGASLALLQVLRSPQNYRLGKAQWVPLRALSALVAVGDASVAPQLRPLLEHRGDPDLQRATIATLQALTGKHLAESQPLPVQVESWMRQLSPDIASAHRK